jgi:hypothetical protein
MNICLGIPLCESIDEVFILLKRAIALELADAAMYTAAAQKTVQLQYFEQG